MGYSFYKYYEKYMVAVWQIDLRGEKISFNKVLQQFPFDLKIIILQVKLKKNKKTNNNITIQ